MLSLCRDHQRFAGCGAINGTLLIRYMIQHGLLDNPLELQEFIPGKRGIQACGLSSSWTHTHTHTPKLPFFEPFFPFPSLPQNPKPSPLLSNANKTMPRNIRWGGHLAPGTWHLGVLGTRVSGVCVCVWCVCVFVRACMHACACVVCPKEKERKGKKKKTKRTHACNAAKTQPTTLR